MSLTKWMFAKLLKTNPMQITFLKSSFIRSSRTGSRISAPKQQFKKKRETHVALVSWLPFMIYEESSYPGDRNGESPPPPAVSLLCSWKVPRGVVDMER